MNQDILLKIKTISLISFCVLAAIAIGCFFIFDLKEFLSILAGSFLTFLLFMATVLLYTRIARAASQKVLSSLLLVLAGKLMISAIAFFLIYRFSNLNILYFIITYLIFFTIFFNIEIFLLYRKIIL